MGADKFLVTGAMGCIGAWVLRHLIDEEAGLVATDLGTDPVRPRLLLDDDEIAAVDWRQLDVTDTRAVESLVAEEGITHIVHLAGLQIPFCRANPPLGAAVNVVGTVNIFEAARKHGVKGLSYASSLAAFGPAELYPERPVPDDAKPNPVSLYGVFKNANEETARIYWQDWQVGSVGLRPYTVYGVGRDQGLTADNAKAVLAAAAGRPFHIRYGGEVALQHASDVARIFIGCARAAYQGATVCNLRGDVIGVEEFANRLSRMYQEAEITWDADNELPFPADLSDAGLRRLLGEVPHTPLEDAIAADVARYRDLIARDRIDMTQLDR